MERKQDSQEEEMVQTSNNTINGDGYDHHHDYDVSEKDDDDDGDDEGLDILKKEIACHSLYGLLIESHLDCLKLCLGDMESIENVINPTTTLPNQYPNLFTDDQSELDQFMKAYCVTLNKLKEVIEEPQQESMAFINFMYSQLEELIPDISSSPTLSALTSSRGRVEKAELK